jgi:hypothetical protein
MTSAHSEMGQMAVCNQNLTLGALCSYSMLSVLVGSLFKKVGIFLTTLILLWFDSLMMVRCRLKYVGMFIVIQHNIEGTILCILFL